MSTENRVLPHPLLTHDRLAQFFWIVMDALSRQNALPLEMSKVRDLPDIEQVLRDYFAQDPDDFERGRARLIDSAIFHWQMMRLLMPADDVQYNLTADGIEWLDTYEQDSFRALDLFRERMSQTLWFAQTGLSGAELESHIRIHAMPIKRINLDDQIRTTFTILTTFGLTGDETKPSAPESVTSPLDLTQTDENPTIATVPIENSYLPTETDENPTIAEKPIENSYPPTETDENPTIAEKPIENSYQPTEHVSLDEDKPITVSRNNMRRRGGGGDVSDNRPLGRSFGRSLDEDVVSNTHEDASVDATPKTSPPPSAKPPAEVPVAPKPNAPPPDDRVGFQPPKAQPTADDETPRPTRNRQIGNFNNTTETHRPSTQPRKYGNSNEGAVGPRARNNRQPSAPNTPPTDSKPPTEPTPPPTPSRKPTAPPPTDKPNTVSDKALGYLQGDNPRSRLNRTPQNTSATDEDTRRQRGRADFYPKGPRATPTQKPPPTPESISGGGEYYYEEQQADGRIIRLSKKVVDDLMVEQGITREEAIRILRDLEG